MKSFCILEQSGHINEPLTSKKKEMFTTDFSDFFRLNWREENDPDAFTIAKGAGWSEGRSLLYERVPKDYEYYIFIDDDIDFSADLNVDIPKKIKELLEKYKPMAGTFFNFNQWGFNLTGISENKYLERECFPIAGFDMQSHILCQSFAEVIFPVIYHGAHRSMWYSYWICHTTFPYKQVCFPDIRVSGFRSEWHKKDKKKRQDYEFHEILSMFYRHVKDKSLTLDDKASFVKKNIELFRQQVDQTMIEFTIEDLEKVYDIKNMDFSMRKSLADNLYLSRKSWNRFLSKLNRKLAILQQS